jgi:lipoprotein signal peptidase
LLFDLISKLLVRQLGLFRPNLGISGGIGTDLPQGLIIIVSSLLLAWLWFKLNSPAERLLLVGGWGNLLDRVVHGSVTDWIVLPSTGLWFNLADIYITLGLLAFIIFSLSGTRTNKLDPTTANI